jgi:hypothetical protein
VIRREVEGESSEVDTNGDGRVVDCDVGVLRIGDFCVIELKKNVLNIYLQNNFYE